MIWSLSPPVSEHSDVMVCQVMSSMHMSEVTICYGMTETSPVSFQTSPDDPVQERVSTVGRVHPHVQAKVVDPESGMLLPRGIPGDQLPVVSVTGSCPSR